MALSAFDDRSRAPADGEIEAALGPASVLWNELKRLVCSEVGPLDEEWGYTSKSTGWGLRLRRGKRIVLYMTPRKGHFLASLTLGEKAVTAARTGGLPASVLRVIDGAPRYPEGRGVRLEVRNPADVRSVATLVLAKLAHTRPEP